MFHPGLSKCRFFHPSSAVSPCVVGPTWSFHQHIQAHQWCKGIRRAIVVDNAPVHNERSAFRYSFIGYESAFAFRPDSSRAGCGPSLLHPLSGAGHERNCPTRILRGLRVRSAERPAHFGGHSINSRAAAYTQTRRNVSCRQS